MRPQLGVRQLSKIQSPGQCWSSPLQQGMAPTSTLRRPTGHRPAASKTARGAILLGAHARAERAYKDWKWAVDGLWEHERHRLQMAAHQRLLDEHAAHKRQEATHQEAACAAQCLLYKRAVTNARRPPARKLLALVKAFLTYELPLNVRRLFVANTSSKRRPLVTNALPTHDRWRQPESSSCGFAVNASTPGLLTRPCGNSNVRLLLPACNTSRNAALACCKRRSSVSRRPPCEQRP
jgi:hypothetical protein